MADLTGLDTLTLFLNEDINGFSIPSKFRFMQEFWIQVRISQRLSTTGSFRRDMPIPRMWTGYYYLMSENCIFKSGAIEYQNQEIYRALNFTWNTEVAVNENAFNLSTPEFPVDIDAIDEAAEGELWLGTSDRQNIYLPVQLPIDYVRFFIPVGCELQVMLVGRRFSPISVAGGGNDIDLYADENEDGQPDRLINTPLNPDAFPPMNEGEVIQTFDEIARARGYIPREECRTLYSLGYWAFSYDYSFSNGAGGIISGRQFFQIRGYRCENIYPRGDYPRGGCSAPTIWGIWSDSRNAWVSERINCGASLSNWNSLGFSLNSWGYDDFGFTPPLTSPC